MNKCEHKWMAWDCTEAYIAPNTAVLDAIIWKCRKCGEIKKQNLLTHNEDKEQKFIQCMERNRNELDKDTKSEF